MHTVVQPSPPSIPRPFHLAKLIPCTLQTLTPRSPLPTPPAPGNPHSAFCLWELALGASSKRNHTVFGLFRDWLLPLPVLKAHPCCNICQNVFHLRFLMFSCLCSYTHNHGIHILSHPPFKTHQKSSPELLTSKLSFFKGCIIVSQTDTTWLNLTIVRHAGWLEYWMPSSYAPCDRFSSSHL